MASYSNTTNVVKAFLQGRKITQSTCKSDGQKIYSYGVPIIWRADDDSIQFAQSDQLPTDKNRRHLKECQEALAEQEQV